MNWSAFRQRELPFLEEASYLDYALRGLVTQSSLEACELALAACARGREARPQQALALERLRASLLGLVGWGDGQVGFTANTTTAIALLAGSIPWRPGDRIVVHADEVLGNRLPWRAVSKRFGLELVELPSREGRLELEDLAEACQEPVAWASLAAVSLGSGDIRPLTEVREIVHSAGGRLCVDAAQGIGCVPVGAADAIVGSGRKWLCGPPEVGFLLMRDAAAESLIPLSAGACSGTGARALEGGVPPLVPAIGLLASLEVLGEFGWEELQAGVQERSRRVLELGQAAGWKPCYPHKLDRQGPLVHFALPEGSPPDLEAQLEARKIFARVLPDQGTLRVSPHAWTTEAEIQALFAALADIG